MRLSSVMTIACMLVSAIHLSVAQPQTAAPKPGPEHEQLAMLVGEWAFEGETKDSTLGPGKFSGTSSARFVHNGFFVEVGWTAKGPFGVLEGSEMRAYDAASKTHKSHWFLNDGSRIEGTETFAANGFSSDMVLTDSKGQKVLLKARWDFALDRSAFTSRWDMSADGGKTWSRLREYHGRRTDKPGAPRRP
jgi:hypothetical protein